MSAILAFISAHKVGVGIAAAIALIAGAVAFTTLSGGDDADAEERIVVAPVERRTLQDVVTVSGEISHEELGSLNMLADGRITALRVDDGDTVHEGQEVVAVDGRPAVAEQGAFLWRPLEEGAIGFDVLQLEQILAAHGLDPGPIDLDFTPETRTALLAWQARYSYSLPEPEPEETVNFSLQSGNGYDIGARASAGGTIVEEPGGVPQQIIEEGGLTPPPAGEPDTSGYVPRAPLPDAALLGLLRPTVERSAPAVLLATTPQINLAVSPTTVVEGDVARLIFQASVKAPSDLTINYSVSGTAAGGPDYDIIGGTAILETGDRQVEVLVQTFDDPVLEPDETIIVDLDPGSGYDVGPDDRATITITDETVPEVTVTGSPAEVEEGGTATFTFKADQKLLEDTQVDFSVGGDATEEDDFEEVVDDNVIIKAGSDRATLKITTIKDSVLEGGESLTVEVSSPPDFLEGSYQLGSVVEAEVEIIDDFNSLPVLDVTVDDLRIAEGDDAAFTIEANVDIADDIEVFYVLGGSTVQGADYPETDDSVQLSGGAADDDEDTATADVSVSMDEDGVVEGDETITLTLLPSPNHEYRIGNGSRTITVESEDIPEISVGGGGRVYEGGPMTFTIVADQRVAEATSVSYQLGGTADEGDDYKSTEGVVIMPAGSISVTVVLRTIDDDAVFQPGDMIVGEWPTRVGTVQVDLGEFVVEGTPLMSLTEDELTVTITMTPTDRAKLEEGLDATVELTATDETAEAVIDVLEDTPEVDDNGGQSYLGEVQVRNDEELSVVDGASVSVDVVLEEVEDAIVVPVAALVGSGADVEVRIVNEDGSLTRVAVVTGLTEGAYVEIVEGLEGTERVIVEVSG